MRQSLQPHKEKLYSQYLTMQCPQIQTVLQHKTLSTLKAEFTSRKTTLAVTQSTNFLLVIKHGLKKQVFIYIFIVSLQLQEQKMC